MRHHFHMMSVFYCQLGDFDLTRILRNQTCKSLLYVNTNGRRMKRGIMGETTNLSGDKVHVGGNVSKFYSHYV